MSDRGRFLGIWKPHTDVLLRTLLLERLPLEKELNDEKDGVFPTGVGAGASAISAASAASAAALSARRFRFGVTLSKKASGLHSRGNRTRSIPARFARGLHPRRAGPIAGRRTCCVPYLPPFASPLFGTQPQSLRTG